VINNETLIKLKQQIVTEKKTPHVMIQFKEIPTTFNRELLLNKGIKLLNYLGSNTWYASVSDTKALLFTDPEVIRKDLLLGSVRFMGEIAPEDKVARLIREKRIGTWARTTDGEVKLVISYFDDVNLDLVKTRLQALGARILGGVEVVNNLVIIIEEQKIPDIAAEDFVCWIETVPPLSAPETNRIRTHVQADLAQNAPLNLTGDGIIVGVFENSHAYINHPDLSTRAFKGDADVNNYFWHATNMAGIIAGNGTNTYQYRGMATKAEIYTYDFEPGTATGTTEDNHLNFCGDLETAIGTDHIDIANNSWGTSGCADFPYGEYNGLCPTLDAAVRGDLGKPISVVFSAGNERSNTDCVTNTTAPFENYSTMNHPKGAKNIIAVGAIDSYNNRMSTYSSWGPLSDGRLKPDIVASGHHNGTLSSGVTEPTTQNQMYTAPSYYPNNPALYGSIGMTSAAAAATSGCLALLMESYKKTMQTDIDPLPSTMKALLIHSALDLDDNTTWYNPGPDYASGYGLLQIKDAVDLVGSFLFIEGKIYTNRSDEYTFTLPAGATSAKVTLVWDDPQAALNAASALVNDLDLEVYDPNNNRHYPWTLDPANPSNAAVRTVTDHLNNVEQVFVNQNLTTGTWRVVVSPFALVESPQRYSLVADYSLNGKVDIMQVLDRSGSMSEMASSGMQGTKIQKLKDAASEFVAIMAPNIGNRLGLVKFNQDVVPFPAGSGDELSLLDNAKANLLQSTTIPNIVNGGTTSIGDGLRAALDQFLSVNSPNGRSILLVTDGMENTPTWISDVQPDLISNDVTVHILGLGYGSGINESKLVNLAQATGGTYRITSDHLVFQKLYIETLAGAVDWSVINDPVGTISRGSVVRIPVTIATDQVEATFTAYWEGIDDAINVELLAPSGRIIPTTPEIANIRYRKHAHYVSYQLDFPLIGDMEGEWTGEWTIKLTGTNRIEQNNNVRFSTSAFAESGPAMDVSFNKISNLAGDEVELKAKLTRSVMPLTGATIEVFGDVPVVGAGNVLHEGKVNWDQLQQPMVVNGDTLNMIDRKLLILSKTAGKDVLQRGNTQFQLYDDGLHGDGAANDGFYANKFTNTKTQGSYTFRFVASGIPAGGERTTTCEWTKSFFNEININPASSDISFTKTNITSNGIKYDVNIALKDIYGNYMGPGHDVTTKITYQGTSREIKLTDHIDGSYSHEIILTDDQVKSGVEVEIYVDGKRFTVIKPPTEKWSLSLHAGAAIPTGHFSNDYKPGLSVIFDFDYHFTNRLSLVGLVGYNDFKAKTIGVDDNYQINISANVRYCRTLRFPFSVYFGGGPGVYFPENGNTEFGANLGFSFNYELNSRLNFELGADYHTLFGNNVQFTVSHIGVVLRF
jgi:hypothetical protein